MPWPSPVYATEVLHGGAAEYTLLLSVRSVGEMGGRSSAAGRRRGSAWAGRSCSPWSSGGVLFFPPLFITSVPAAVVTLFVAGLVGTSQGPWVQTLRMRAIPPSGQPRVRLDPDDDQLAGAGRRDRGRLLVAIVGVPAIFGLVAVGWLATSAGLASVRDLRESVA